VLIVQLTVLGPVLGQPGLCLVRPVMVLGPMLGPVLGPIFVCLAKCNLLECSRQAHYNSDDKYAKHN
jgi:hypothetical protein